MTLGERSSSWRMPGDGGCSQGVLSGAHKLFLTLSTRRNAGERSFRVGERSGTDRWPRCTEEYPV
jgi:hypothetical protein